MSGGDYCENCGYLRKATKEEIKFGTHYCKLDEGFTNGRSSCVAWKPKEKRINEIKAGQIFIVRGNGGHPKLKLKFGFVDMRSRSLHRSEKILLPLDIQILTNSQIKWAFKRCGIDIKGWKDLRKELLQEYN